MDKKFIAKKKKYGKPEVVSEKIYEKNALACGKNPAIRRTSSCRLVPKISWIGVYDDEKLLAKGQGKSKKLAEEEAARKALQKL